MVPCLIANHSSAADPASALHAYHISYGAWAPPTELLGIVCVGLGVSAFLANWMRMQLSNYKAAFDELTYFLEIAPQSDEGAISHMANEVQLWCAYFIQAPCRSLTWY